MSKRFPFSLFPTGWYVVAAAGEPAPGAVVPRRLMGREVVLYRTAGGVAHVADAYCPHLGAHFGFGGTVEKETLRCPFHGFLFDGEGRCVATSYGQAPPNAARLHQWPVREHNGFVMVWWDAAGRPPSFEVPLVPSEGWSPLWRKTFPIRSHPQETAENSVDVGHFSTVHGYTGFETLRELATDGPYLNVRYGMFRDSTALGRPGQKMRVEYDIHIHGLGWSLVEATLPELGMRTRHYVLPTPTDGEHVDMTIALALERIADPGRISPFLKVLPAGLLERIVGGMAFRGYVHDVSQDLAVWENKEYIHPPALAKGDGPIGRYRQWARQFYVDEPVATAAG